MTINNVAEADLFDGANKDDGRKTTSNKVDGFKSHVEAKLFGKGLYYEVYS